MKRIFSGAAVILVLCATVAAQDTVAIGFVNAVGLASKTDFKIDAKSLKPAGFGQGEYAGSFGLSEGNHQFAFSNDGCDKVETSVQVKKGSSPLYVLYNVTVPQETGIAKNVLKVTGIAQQSSARQPRFFAFSTLEGRRADLRIDGQAISLQQLKLTSLPDGVLTIDSDSGKPIRIAPREAGNYVVIVFLGSDSRLRWAFVEMTH